MKDKFVALITARGGSKGLPRKNVLTLYDKPLISWTIDAALNCSQIERVFVTTDDKEIADISKKWGAEVIQRPAVLASDTASSIDVISHAISWLESHNIPCQRMVLLQPTSPLRTSQHLQEAFNVFYEHNANLVISVFEPSHTPIKSYIECENGNIKGLYSDEAPYARRQDLPKAFQPNGAIYAFLVNEFKINNHFPRSKVFPYVMSKENSIDIDTLEDLNLVERKLKEVNK
ncbi:cytidylyltransferase domain-containing protein [Vibrio misgurnus]|uniref:acylneuraminate cytidylyltransferase family protein n=1 Tax=Vibrio misgurnus TaxID=2993714 RepID=UPI0024167403|nr:acylneuraminate cytidylyltransferase family protein [Vibrio sp. gvc]